MRGSARDPGEGGRARAAACSAARRGSKRSHGVPVAGIAPPARLVRRVAEVLLLVVPEHALGAELAHAAQHPGGIRSTIEEVAHEHQAIAATRVLDVRSSSSSSSRHPWTSPTTSGCGGLTPRRARRQYADRGGPEPLAGAPQSARRTPRRGRAPPPPRRSADAVHDAPGEPTRATRYSRGSHRAPAGGRRQKRSSTVTRTAPAGRGARRRSWKDSSTRPRAASRQAASGCSSPRAPRGRRSPRASRGR